MKHIILTAAALLLCFSLGAQKYKGGVADKTIAVVGGETILLSDLEAEVQQMRMNGTAGDRDMRCELLENMMESKLFLMQARVDSLNVSASAAVLVYEAVRQRLGKHNAYEG